jgi:hypothetical protein
MDDGARRSCNPCSRRILVPLLLCMVSVLADSTLRLSRSPPLINGYDYQQQHVQTSKAENKDKQSRLRINRVLKSAPPAASWRAIIESSKPIRRALYFWSRAGPIVAHYRFTQWWIQKYPKEDRDQIYERLHDA